MVSISKILTLGFYLSFFIQVNASIVQQFFIKIRPNQELVTCGSLSNTKTKVVYKNFVKDQKVDIVSPLEALNWIQDSMKNHANAKIVFYIHGFWASKPMIVHRTTKVFQKEYFNSDTSNIVAIVNIIWDSNHLYYKNSIESIENSKNTLSSLLNNIDSIRVRKSLMCHSMGNRFLYYTLKSTQHKVNFEELLLIAPDLNHIAFKDSSQLFKAISNQVIVFFNTKDKTLKMSKTINKVERLGRIYIALNDPKIIFKDFSDLKDINSLTDKVMRHLYFITSKSTISEIQNILDY